MALTSTNSPPTVVGSEVSTELRALCAALYRRLRARGVSRGEAQQETAGWASVMLGVDRQQAEAAVAALMSPAAGNSGPR